MSGARFNVLSSRRSPLHKFVIQKITKPAAWQCAKEAEIWHKISSIGRRMWESFTTTTIGEWGDTIFAFALLPAQLASYILPFVFLSCLIKRTGPKSSPVLDGREEKRKWGWGGYLFVAGIITVLIGTSDRFMIITGIWEIVCAAVIFFLSPTWWATKKGSTARRYAH
jgi:hypothetical protein